MAKRRAGRGKTVSESATVTTRIMMPTDANILGNVFGGAIMKYMDEAAAIAAFRHARRNVVTASIDRMDFITPVYVGDLLVLKAAVNYVGRTSMEVGVRIEAENLRTGEVIHAGSCFLTYVALDADKRPVPVGPIVPVSTDEKRRHREAMTRRALRKASIEAIRRLGA
jgi:acyl-CoA hydrolase